MRRLNTTAWLLVKLWQLLKVVYFGLEFVAVLLFTIIAYMLMLPFMALIFLIRLLFKPFRKKGDNERVNIQPIRKQP